jgi:hypothetical protein
MVTETLSTSTHELVKLIHLHTILLVDLYRLHFHSKIQNVVLWWMGLWYFTDCILLIL